MAKLFIFGIGGTGSRVIKSLTMLLASGIKSFNDFDIIPIIIDPHKDNEDLKRTVSILDHYQKIKDKIGTNNEFFGTKITTLQSLDSKRRMGGTYSFTLKAVSNTKFKDYFSYSSLNDENKSLAELLFSGKSIDTNKKEIDLLDIPMDIGFVGNPNIGSVVLNQFRDSDEFKDFANNFSEGDRIFIISSIFGGTGAAGFPIVLKNIRNAVNNKELANGGYLQNSAIGALTVLPYFNIETDKDSPIKRGDFIEKTKAALGYYQNNVNPILNAMYYVGDDYSGKPYKNDAGQGGQKNDAHFIEIAGALAIIDFMNTDSDSLLCEGGKPILNICKEYSIKEDAALLNFKHLNDYSNTILRRNLVQFTLFKKYLDKQFEQSIGNKTWSTDTPAIDHSFKNNQFFNSNLKSFLKAYEDWLTELNQNSRGFAPFNLSSDINTTVNGFEMSKSMFGLGKFDFDKFDMELNRTVRNEVYSSADQKLIQLFFKATSVIVSNRYGF
ncbi:hypothetical protein HDF26_004566 [Pedobacter cryoconitis]|uniref:hypothetical protein n=1 Tax=Pedobacter cryoconitis TaxID=188932 RepID=UPI00161F5407|nr:hypothetical protein [Pedobacter cryoconitis]MBB6274093.1 hypothetical protein [Pedobacter cryoconitis]